MCDCLDQFEITLVDDNEIGAQQVMKIEHEGRVAKKTYDVVLGRSTSKISISQANLAPPNGRRASPRDHDSDADGWNPTHV